MERQIHVTLSAVLVAKDLVKITCDYLFICRCSCHEAGPFLVGECLSFKCRECASVVCECCALFCHCGEIVCASCSLKKYWKQCRECTELICNKCFSTQCSECNLQKCISGTCGDCGVILCLNCGIKCDGCCKQLYCQDCLDGCMKCERKCKECFGTIKNHWMFELPCSVCNFFVQSHEYDDVCADCCMQRCSQCDALICASCLQSDKIILCETCPKPKKIKI